MLKNQKTPPEVSRKVKEPIGKRYPTQQELESGIREAKELLPRINQVRGSLNLEPLHLSDLIDQYALPNREDV